MLVAPSTVQEPQEVYTLRDFSIDRGTLEELQALSPHRTFGSIAAIWMGAIGLTWGFLYLQSHSLDPYLPILLYPIFVLAIAGRMGAFLQVMHEAAHRLVSKNPLANDTIANWLSAYPIGLTFEGYASGHAMHHAYTNQKLDPTSDREKYRVCNARNPRLWLLFLKDFSGITALQVFFAYKKNHENEEQEKDALEGEQRKRPSGMLASFARIALVQAFILGAFFDFSVRHYIALWIVPAISGSMLLLRVRGIAEHGLGIQLGSPRLQERGIGTFYTRSFLTPVNRYPFVPLTWIEKLLIGSLNVSYHHEHHLLPTVPYYHLPKLHVLVADRVKTANPYAYAKGYFSCLFVRAAS